MMAIIRRMDLDGDARLSKQEFMDGLKPEVPYSKSIKRQSVSASKMRRNPFNSTKKNLS